MDISADGSFLLVAQGSGTVFQRLDLNNGAVTNIPYSPADHESNAWDVAIGSNGLALVSTRFDGSGWVPLRQIDLSSNAITLRTDAPGSGILGQVRQDTYIHRSADRSRFYFLESNSSAGPVFTCSATTDSFGMSVQTQSYLGGRAAVNRNGSAVATGFGARTTIDTAPGFHFVRSIQNAGAGLVFDAVMDRIYATNTSAAAVVAYDSTSGAELFRVPVGEAIPLFSPFDTGLLIASPDGHYLAISTPSGVRLLTIPANPPPPPAPTFGTPRDLVFDPARTYLYIGTAEGLIWRYHLANGMLGTPYNLGGSLNGLDVAPDGSFAIAAQEDRGVVEGAFHRLDLATGVVTNFTFPRTFSEGGAWDVAIGSNGIALASSRYFGSGSVPLRQIALDTGVMSIRTDAPGSGGGGRVAQDTQICRSVNGTLMYLLEPNTFPGPVFTYSAITNTFGSSAQRNVVLSTASAAVNRNGTLLARGTSSTAVTLETAPNFGFVHTLNALTGGVAFDAVQDVVYGVSPYLSQIIAYDTNTFVERFRFDIGENFSAGITQFGRGILVASNDGRYLALNTGTAVRITGPRRCSCSALRRLKTTAAHHSRLICRWMVPARSRAAAGARMASTRSSSPSGRISSP
ncbi:MAG: YncE family protein [Chthoniobacterales bacterium]